MAVVSTRHRPASGPTARRVAAVALAVLLSAACAGRADREAVAGPPAADPAVATQGDAATPDRPRSPTPRPAPPPPPPRPRSFTLAVTGDLLPHQPVVAAARAEGAAAGRPYDFAPLLAPVRPLIERADLALCHLETPLSADGRVSGYPTFNAPAELAEAVAATGYDGCSTASNHAVDRGLGGVGATLDALDAAGLRHAGTARSPEEDAQAAWFDPRGVRVAHLSATYGLNGLPVPAGAPWSVDLIDPAALLAEAAAARAAGAEFVVVSLHWGTEYRTEPTEEQRSLAAQVLASPDVDVIVGHHAHVVQPVERVGGKVVVFGLGNFLSNQSAACCVASTQDGVVVTLTVTEDVRERRPGPFRVIGVLATPTYVQHPGFRVLPVPQLLADPATPPGLRSELERSAARTTAAIGPSTAVVGAP